MGRSTLHYADSDTNNILKKLHNKLRPAGTPVQRVEYIWWKRIRGWVCDSGWWDGSSDFNASFTSSSDWSAGDCTRPRRNKHLKGSKRGVRGSPRVIHRKVDSMSFIRNRTWKPRPVDGDERCVC